MLLYAHHLLIHSLIHKMSCRRFVVKSNDEEGPKQIIELISIRFEDYLAYQRCKACGCRLAHFTSHRFLFLVLFRLNRFFGDLRFASKE